MGKRKESAKAREARIRAAWEAEGGSHRTDVDTSDAYVRIVCESECEPLETFAPNWQGSELHAWYAHVERVGLWWYATQYRATLDAPWETADSIGGIEGDWSRTGYDLDCMQAALEALDKARQDEANALASRATYAGVSP